MGLRYKYEEANIADLLLDDENPRYASSRLVKEAGYVSQDIIIKHLLKYANIIDLAKRIDIVQELHGSELITCYIKNGKYIVIEGNRRVCACQLLLNRDIIPNEYKLIFPTLTQDTKENIERITINVYPNRESVQAYLSDRHIKGVKKWSSLEKNNFYMNLYSQYKVLDKITQFTSDSIPVIKNCIRKYQFFMDVYNALDSRYINAEIENLDYLPLVNKFMDTLLGNDKEVGLDLLLDEMDLRYHCQNDKEGIYNNILFLIGDAFLIRKEKNSCAKNEPYC